METVRATVTRTIKKPRNTKYNGTSPANAEASGNVDLSQEKVTIVKQQIPAGNHHAVLHPSAHNPYYVCFNIQVPSVLC